MLDLHSGVLFAKDALYVTIIVENVSRYCHYEVEGGHSAAMAEIGATERKL